MTRYRPAEVMASLTGTMMMRQSIEASDGDLLARNASCIVIGLLEEISSSCRT